MNKHLRKIKNGLWDILQALLVVVIVVVFAALAIAPVIMASELHWAWALLYIPVVMVWAYIMGDE